MGELDDYLNDGEHLLYTTDNGGEYLGFTEGRVIFLKLKGLFGKKGSLKI
jgi:hypothetical protein